MSRLALIGRRAIPAASVAPDGSLGPGSRLVRTFKVAPDGTLSPARPPLGAPNVSRVKADAGKRAVLTPVTVDGKQDYVITAIEC